MDDMTTSYFWPILFGTFGTINSPPVQEWDEKQLVAALENATLLDLQKLLKVQPIKASTLGSSVVRRGRFSPPAAVIEEAVANLRLDVVYVFCLQKSFNSIIIGGQNLSIIDPPNKLIPFPILI